jgi:hypothetical protein
VLSVSCTLLATARIAIMAICAALALPAEPLSSVELRRCSRSAVKSEFEFQPVPDIDIACPFASARLCVRAALADAVFISAIKFSRTHAPDSQPHRARLNAASFAPELQLERNAAGTAQ